VIDVRAACVVQLFCSAQHIVLTIDTATVTRFTLYDRCNTQYHNSTSKLTSFNSYVYLLVSGNDI